MKTIRTIPALALAAVAAIAQGEKKDAAPATPAPAAPAFTDEQKQMMEAYEKMMAPGEEHRKLDVFVGEWDLLSRAWVDPAGAPIETRGSVKKSWALDGRWLLEELASVDPMGKPYSGTGYLGFDKATKRYQGAWMSSSSTGMITYTGSVSADGKAFTHTGKEPNPMDGSMLDFRIVVTVESPDRHTLAFTYILPDKSEMKGFELVHTRKK